MPGSRGGFSRRGGGFQVPCGTAGKVIMLRKERRRRRRLFFILNGGEAGVLRPGITTPIEALNGDALGQKFRAGSRSGARDILK